MTRRTAAAALASDPREPVPGTSADAQLVRLMQERNAYGFELVYERHAAAAFGLAQRMLRDRALAEDVTQEAFMSVWRGAHRFNPELGSVRTWVLGITRNRAIDVLRRRSAQARVTAREERSTARLQGREATDTLVLRQHDARVTRTAVETLPGDQRRAIELAYFSGLTHTEIAGTLDLPLGTVKGRMRLGLEKLRRALDASEVAA